MAGHWIGASGQVRALAKAVSAAFAASNLTAEEKAPGKIEIVDLPWQAPPLITDALLMGGELQDYLDVPLAVDEESLRKFWVKTLQDMMYTPSRLLKRGAHTNCGWAMPKVKVGQRALRFSRPAGFPGQLEDLAGVMFSLEVAQVARCSLPIQDVVIDNDNYYVVMPDATLIGVKNGRPACVSDWDYDASGYIPDLLTMARGETDYTCRFDEIASLRSVLHVHRKRFPKSFEALDLALQTLRLLTLGGHCPELVQEMYVAPIDMTQARAIEQVLRDAVELMPVQMSDRSKLQTLHGLLVPAVLSASGFRKYIFSNPQFPFTLAPGKLDSIEAWLRQEYASRVPAAIQQLKETKK